MFNEIQVNGSPFFDPRVKNNLYNTLNNNLNIIWYLKILWLLLLSSSFIIFLYYFIFKIFLIIFSPKRSFFHTNNFIRTMIE